MGPTFAATRARGALSAALGPPLLNIETGLTLLGLRAWQRMGTFQFARPPMGIQPASMNTDQPTPRRALRSIFLLHMVAASVCFAYILAAFTALQVFAEIAGGNWPNVKALALLLTYWSRSAAVLTGLTLLLALVTGRLRRKMRIPSWLPAFVAFTLSLGLASGALTGWTWRFSGFTTFGFLVLFFAGSLGPLALTVHQMALPGVRLQGVHRGMRLAVVLLLPALLAEYVAFHGESHSPRPNETFAKTRHLDVENPTNEVRAAVAREFPNLTPDQKRLVLTELWPRARCPQFINVLLPLAKMPTKSERFYRETIGDLAMIRLLELKPESVRSLVLEDLQRARPLLNLSVLLALPDRKLPELDDSLLAHLNSDDDLEAFAPAIEHYASARILPQVIAFYVASEGRWACTIQTAFLRYWLKHDRPAALSAIEHAMSLRADTGCFHDLLGETLRDSFDKGAEALTLKFIHDADSEVATDALLLLARFGSATAKDSVIQRLTELSPTHEPNQWNLNNRVQILDALRQAKGWIPTADQKRRIAQLLSSGETERYWKLVTP